MIILLLTLLTIAFAIIVIGIFLSPRYQEPGSPRVSYAGRSTRARRAERSLSRRLPTYDPGRVRRTTMDFEYRPVSFNIASLLNIRNVMNPRAGDPTSWLGIALILVTLSLTGLILFRNIFPDSVALQATWPDVAASSAPPANRTVSHPTFPGLIQASQSLVRINQLDAAQYNSTQEYGTWAYSACSAASMTEVINAYNAYYHTGKQYRITDILKVESGIGAISSDLGLLEPTGIDRTVAHFNFQVTWLKNPSLNDVINTANGGRPVIVNFPPDRWSGGHLLVVRGGNRDYVYLADSSRLNMQAMARATYMKYWAGFAAVMTPIK
jgi:hypothetical protein